MNITDTTGLLLPALLVGLVLLGCLLAFGQGSPTPVRVASPRDEQRPQRRTLRSSTDVWL